MNTVAGAILVLAGAILIHGVAIASGGYTDFAFLAGIVIGIVGLVVVTTSLKARSEDQQLGWDWQLLELYPGSMHAAFISVCCRIRVGI